MKNKVPVEMLVVSSAMKTSSLSLITEKGKQVEEHTEVCDMIIAENVFYCSIQNGPDMIILPRKIRKDARWFEFGGVACLRWRLNREVLRHIFSCLRMKYLSKA